MCTIVPKSHHSGFRSDLTACSGLVVNHQAVCSHERLEVACPGTPGQVLFDSPKVSNSILSVSLQNVPFSKGKMPESSTVGSGQLIEYFCPSSAE